MAGQDQSAVLRYKKKEFNTQLTKSSIDIAKDEGYNVYLIKTQSKSIFPGHLAQLTTLHLKQIFENYNPVYSEHAQEGSVDNEAFTEKNLKNLPLKSEKPTYIH